MDCLKIKKSLYSPYHFLIIFLPLYLYIIWRNPYTFWQSAPQNIGSPAPECNIAPKSTRFIINDIREYIDIEKDFPNYKIECLYESSCGAVVFRDIKGEIRYLLIKNRRSAHWGFPKGHIEMGETKEETALREVLEETGIHMRLIEGFECISKYKIQNRIEKVVSIFVGTTQDTSTSIQAEEIEDYIWLTYDRALSLLKFDNDKNIITAAHNFLNQNNYI